MIMKIYHYTKGFCLNSIFTDGFIATETKRCISGGKKETDHVWLTEKNIYPKTALPMISELPETDLLLHAVQKSMNVNLDRVGKYTGNVYRFGFNSTDGRFKKWWHSEERTFVKSNQLWSAMESIANKVGDDVRSFWICPNDVQLEDFSLEVYAGGWITLIENGSVKDADLETLTLIYSLMESSKSKCLELGMPVHHIPPAEISESFNFKKILSDMLNYPVTQ
jgi:hypothetical protein